MPKETKVTHGLLRPVVVSAVFFMAVTGLAYPLVVTGIANVLFPHQAQGSLITQDGKVIGSEVIGQQFDKPGYFHSRPSLTANAPYNGGASGASNHGPTNRKLIDAVGERVAAYRAENGLPADALVPVDAVTASASGLDPDISLANAQVQAARVARHRDLAEQRVRALIDTQATPRVLGLLGEPRVNVLQLNRALDAMHVQAMPVQAMPVQ